MAVRISLLNSSENRHNRHLVITDSLVSIGAVMKGRSSSPPILRLLRNLAAWLLLSGATVYARWVPSGRNWADGPSRGRSIQAEAKHRAPLVRYDPLQDKAIAEIVVS